ncbi:MAG: hypothetical protein ABI369_11065 [Acetobacteraceae bacterium]
MRKTLMLAAAAATLAGAVGTAAMAQTATPTPAPEAAAPSATGPHGMKMGEWRHHGGPGERAEHRAMGFGHTLGLFAPTPDKHLSPADVQEIAQAILLWNGNHDWKVAQVQPGANNQVNFAYTAPDGTVIAKFAINQDTGRITRLG